MTFRAEQLFRQMTGMTLTDFDYLTDQMEDEYFEYMMALIDEGYDVVEAFKGAIWHAIQETCGYKWKIVKAFTIQFNYLDTHVCLAYRPPMKGRNIKRMLKKIEFLTGFEVEKWY